MQYRTFRSADFRNTKGQFPPVKPCRFLIPCKSGGFTLLELCIAIAVIVVLSAISFAGVRLAIDKAKASRAVAAGRSLCQAYQLAAMEQNNRLLAGYNMGAIAHAANGAVISGVAAARYPWRLAPYVDYQFIGTMYVNDGAERLDPSDIYLTSLLPSFGLNAYCLGGYGDGSGAFQVDVARNMDDVPNPAKMIAFASSHVEIEDENGETTRSPGFHLVSPPNMGGSSWSVTSKTAPAATGYVDFRYDARALVVFLDGHVELCDLKALKDMRHWSIGAQKTDNPDYVVPRASTSTVGKKSRK